MTTPGGKRSGRELIPYYLYHARANDAAFDHVALLELGDNRAVLFLRVFDAHDRLVEIRVERLVLRLDIFEPFLFQRFHHLLIHHFDARAEPAFVAAFRRQRALEIIEKRQHILQEVLGDDGGKLTFFVRDTGIGIPKDRLSTIFERFRQGDEGSRRQYGGNGLGLSISNELVRCMQGTMHVKSEVGKGSTFSFTIPYNRAGV